jgi:hypothetical protein
MHPFENLIRSSRRRLDTERQLLSALLALRTCLTVDAESLSTGTGEEADGIEERRGTLERSIAEVEGQIRRVRSAVRDALAQLERHEVTASSQSRRSPGRPSVPSLAGPPYP